MSNPVFEPISVRFEQGAKLTGISRSKLYLLAASGEIETVKIGKARLIKMSSLKKLIGEAA